MKGQIIMSKKEAKRVSIIEQYCQRKITGKQAAEHLGISDRQIRRIAKRYKEKGTEGLIHKSRGRPSNRKIDDAEKELIVERIKENYQDFKPTFATEKLEENHGIKRSSEAVRKIMIEAGLWKAKKKKTMRIYQTRERRSCRGALIQMDGSPHDWFERRGEKCSLLLAIDDADSSLKYGLFVPSESTQSYFKFMRGYIEKNGKPLSLYVDKSSVFRVNTTRGESAHLDDSNGLTQFSRAMKELDIKMIYANSPQAKGRVERAYETLQDRLVKEMRLAGISSMKEGNKFLEKYLKKHNEKFAKQPRKAEDLHRECSEDIDEILLIKETRTLTKNLEFQYQNVRYQIITNRPSYALRKVKIEVRKKANEDIEIFYKDKKLDYQISGLQHKSEIVAPKELSKFVDDLIHISTTLQHTQEDISTLL